MNGFTTNLAFAAALLVLRPAAAQDAFEVATVKPADPDKQPIVAWLSYPGGRVVVTNYTLTMLIEEAYGVSLYRITGAPPWAGEAMYDIVAKAPEGSPAAAYVPPKPDAPPAPESRTMMRALLAGRFGLKLHQETRDLPVWALTVAKGGPKFHPAAGPSAEPEWSLRRGELKARNRNMAWLASILERQFDRTVLDRTGLTGSYDLEVHFDPRGPLDSSAATTPGAWPPLDTALRTQLGLKLQTIKSPIGVLVIDAAGQPGAN